MFMLRVLDPARGGPSGTRSVTFSMRLRVTWICMPSIDRRDRAGHHLVAVLQRHAGGGQQPADVGRGQVHVAHRAAVVELDASWR